MSCRLALCLAASVLASPALAEDGRFVGISAGLGLSAVDSSTMDGSGTGAYARADYLPARGTWFTPILYAGLLYTRPEHDCGANVAPCDVSSQLVFAGARFRMMAPIPYVGPFFELGLGGSVGRMTTEVGRTVGVSWSGGTYHVPAAVGVALGSRHQLEIAFAYMFHPLQRQVNGGATVGFVFSP